MNNNTTSGSFEIDRTLLYFISYMPADESLVRLSGDNIIELTREHRNDLINKLLRDDELNLYLKETFSLSEEVSQIKREFIKRALKELNSEDVQQVDRTSSVALEIALPA